MKKLRIPVTVWVTVDAHAPSERGLVVDVEATGGGCYPGAIEVAIERTEAKVLKALRKAKRLNASDVRADRERLKVENVETTRENYLRRCAEWNANLRGEGAR